MATKKKTVNSIVGVVSWFNSRKINKKSVHILLFLCICYNTHTSAYFYLRWMNIAYKVTVWM